MLAAKLANMETVCGVQEQVGLVKWSKHLSALKLTYKINVETKAKGKSCYVLLAARKGYQAGHYAA